MIRARDKTTTTLLQRLVRSEVIHTRIVVISLITIRKRSLGQGKIFTPVCHSVHRGGVCGCQGGAWLPGDMHGCGGVCMVAGGHA